MTTHHEHKNKTFQMNSRQRFGGFRHAKEQPLGQAELRRLHRGRVPGGLALPPCLLARCSAYRHSRKGLFRPWQ